MNFSVGDRVCVHDFRNGTKPFFGLVIEIGDTKMSIREFLIDEKEWEDPETILVFPKWDCFGKSVTLKKRKDGCFYWKSLPILSYDELAVYSYLKE